jgi:small GTP-binding protein
MLRKLLYQNNNKSNKSIDPEIEEGNIEYKLRLDLKDQHHLNKMATQLIWRLNEGKNIYGKMIAYYYLGIDDDGSIGNINLEVLNTSIDILTNIAKRCNAEITFIDKIHINQNIYIAEIVIEKLWDDKIAKEIRVCVVGDSNSGKTTSLANLLYNQIDDGNGYARKLVFKHKHERETGLTSSIKHDIIGIDKNNNIINYKSLPIITWESIVLKSNYVFSLFDLPGNDKYINTTLFGLTSLKPHYNIIFVSLIDIEKKITQEEKSSKLISPDTPTIIIFTKIDLLDIKEQESIFNNKIEIFQKYITKKITKLSHISNLITEIPYIVISNKNNNNEIFKNLFNFLVSDFKNKLSNNVIHHQTIFNIIEVYNIPDKGTIVSGICIQGKIELNKIYYIGPINKEFIPIKIQTIHKKQISCKKINFDESGSIELSNINNNLFLVDITKNMKIISQDLLDKYIS